MEEVVARKSRAFLAFIAGFAVIDTLAVVFATLFVEVELVKIVLAIALAPIWLYVLIYGIKELSTSSLLIVYSDGVLKFADGKTCWAKEVSDISYTTANGKIGILSVVVGAQTFQYRQVKDIRNVVERLNELVEKAKGH